MNTLIQDMRYSLRVTGKNPGFVAVVVFTLALGIAANSAVFSVFNTVLLRPLPFRDPGQLVALWETIPQFTGRTSVSHPNFLDWKHQSQLSEGMAAYTYGQANLSGIGEPERIRQISTSEGYFSVLAVTPFLGRPFSAGEHGPGANRVTILSHGCWQRRFGSSSDILGKKVMLDGYPHVIVGVMPVLGQGFEPDVWTPLPINPADDRGNFALGVVGRLKPGVSVEQAQTEMTSIARRLELQYPDSNKGVSVTVTNLQKDLFGDQYQQIWISFFTLMAAVGFVLLIACTNVANLLLARASARGKEIAIRTALGAGRRRVIRQLLTESLSLALLGGSLGLLLAFWACNLMNAYFVDANVPLNPIGIDATVLWFTLGVSVITALVFGVLPAFQTTKVNLNETLKEGGRSGPMGSSKHRLNRLLVIAEVTLASVLLIGAGLVTKGFIRLLDTHPGFRKDNVLTMNFSLSGERYKEEPGRRAFYQQLLSRLLAIPGVRSAGLISDIPLSTGSNSVRNFKIENRPVQAPGEVLMENFQLTSPQYLEALSIPLKRGRFFSESDNENAPPVVVINASMAKKHWNLQDPIGKRIQLEGKWRTIVGIIGNVQLLDLQESSRPQMFLPYRQYSEGNLGLVVHTVRDPLSIVSAVRQEVHSLDPLQPITRIRTMKKVISDQYATRQFLMVLMAIFAAVALLLAIVGLYSVMAYSVSQRTREIGVRMALGARQADVSKAVLRRGLLLVAVGTGLGLIIALAVMRSISSLLLGVSPADPPVFVGVSLLLAVVALTACYIPAHQATQVNPVVALRYE